MRQVLGRSEPFLLVDDIDERPTRGEAPAVFEEDRLPFLPVGGAKDRDVRGDQHVGHRP